MDEREKSELVDLILERVFQSMPRMILLHIQQEALLKEAAEGLFQRRPDLREHSLEMAILVNNIFTENPGLSLQEIIKRVEDSELWKK